jgi:hypothetical protein
MAQPKSAAQSLYPNLPSAARPEVEQRNKPTTAQAMYPSQASLVPKRLSYDELRQAWRDHMLALAGIRRKRLP